MKVKLDADMWIADIINDDVIVTGSSMRAKNFDTAIKAGEAVLEARKICDNHFPNAEIYIESKAN
jgi:hypothetical protein